jgi:hypothetical protein
MSAQRPESFKEIKTRPEEWGRMVESTIGAHLINHSLTEGFSLHYWRERNEEVDFVLEYKGKVIGLEIKTSLTKLTTGMSAFQKQMHPDKVLLVGTSGLPWPDFLKLNPVQLFA